MKGGADGTELKEVIKAGAADTVDMINQGELQVKDNSKITFRGREKNVWKPLASK